jgi:6-phosphogluconolactonase
MSDNFEALFEGVDDELDLTLYADATELAAEVVAQALALIGKALKVQSEFHLVLTGGSLGLSISEGLVQEFNSVRDGFKGLHIWWSDERFVEAESADRNASIFHKKLLNSNLVVHQVPAKDQVERIEDSLAIYEKSLKGISLDLNILGVGPDGHVASLFPGFTDIDDQRQVIAITDSPKPPAERITFTMATINSAREVWIVAAGESKSEAVTKIIEADLSIPASYVRGSNHTRLIVDTEAFFTE